MRSIDGSGESIVDRSASIDHPCCVNDGSIIPTGIDRGARSMDFVYDTNNYIIKA